MKIKIAHAEGSVSPTVVIDGSEFDETRDQLFDCLSKIATSINRTSKKLISKFVLLKKSEHPMFDLEYLFIQMIPGTPLRFDLNGSCGHSILCAVDVAIDWNWTDLSSRDNTKIRVHVKNNLDSVVCEIEKDCSSNFTAHFISKSDLAMSEYLPTKRIIDTIEMDGTNYTVSVISYANPYVFIPSNQLGITSESQLFEASEEIKDMIEKIRQKVIERLGWDANSVFPKVALFDSFSPDTISIRSLSVPSWHPTLALTGVACLGLASELAETVVYKLLGERSKGNLLTIRTKGGTTAVSFNTSGSSLDDFAYFCSVKNKIVHKLSMDEIFYEEELLWKMEEESLLQIV